MNEAAAAFDLHGVRLGVAGEPAFVDSAVERLGLLPTAPVGDLDATVRFTVERPDGIPSGDRGGRVVYESRFGPVRYTPGSDELHLVADGLGLHCRCGAGEATIWVDGARADAPWLASRPMLSLVLFELLRRHDLYVLHAAAAAVRSRGLVIVGDSGRGKSTLALALARAGLPLLGDDLVFVGPNGGGEVVLHGFPEPLDLATEGALLFPELADLRMPPPAGWPKHRVPVDRFGVAPASTAVPAVLVFLGARGPGRSRLEPLGEADALLRLVPSVLLTEPERSQRHLDALSRLLAASRPYVLDAGDDPAEAAAAAVALVSDE